MEHLYNTIRPVGKRAIIAIIKGSKESHKFKDNNGKDIELFVDVSYSWDGKVSNPTQGIILTDFKNLKAGTNVLIHHNAATKDNILDIEPDIHTSIHSVDEDFVYFGVKDDDIICVDGFMLAERLYDENEISDGGIILTEKKKRDTVLRIIGKPQSITDYSIGDIAIVYRFSDYEMTHNIGGKIKRIIRLKYSDCLGKVE